MGLHLRNRRAGWPALLFALSRRPRRTGGRSSMCCVAAARTPAESAARGSRRAAASRQVASAPPRASLLLGSRPSRGLPDPCAASETPIAASSAGDRHRGPGIRRSRSLASANPVRIKRVPEAERGPRAHFAISTTSGVPAAHGTHPGAEFAAVQHAAVTRCVGQQTAGGTGTWRPPGRESRRRTAYPRRKGPALGIVRVAAKKQPTDRYLTAHLRFALPRIPPLSPQAQNPHATTRTECVGLWGRPAGDDTC
jgi:hypothetical protein